jgi:GntR family transcriptional regulator
LDKKSPVPFYRQIVDMVLAGVSGGSVGPGERLPTIRDLAVRLEVNPNTISKAYWQLQTLGVLDTQQGSGVFVKARPAKVFQGADRDRAVEALCHDFVGRAQLLGIGVREIVAWLNRMKT